MSIPQNYVNAYNTAYREIEGAGVRGFGPAGAWIGNVLANTGAIPEMMVCVEQAEHVGQVMEAILGSAIDAELVVLDDYKHTILRVRNPNGGWLYADPWGSQGLTSNPSADIYGYTTGIEVILDVE